MTATEVEVEAVCFETSPLSGRFVRSEVIDQDAAVFCTSECYSCLVSTPPRPACIGDPSSIDFLLFFLRILLHSIILSHTIHSTRVISPSAMSRPKSMPDFSVLMDASTPLFEARAQNRRQTSPVRGQGYPRKKLSISLAAGLIMNTDTPKHTATIGSEPRQSLDGTPEEEPEVSEDNLFHAYAIKVSHAVGHTPYRDE
jgi:hypothetical protein